MTRRKSYSALDKVMAMKQLRDTQYNYDKAAEITGIERSLLVTWHTQKIGKVIKNDKRESAVPDDFQTLTAKTKLAVLKIIGEVAQHASVMDIKYLADTLKALHDITLKPSIKDEDAKPEPSAEKSGSLLNDFEM